MQNLTTRLNVLKRPRLLVRATRLGQQYYCRERDLPKILKCANLPRCGVIVLRLLEKEQALNDRRLRDDPGYSICAHVEVLIALHAEAQVLAACRQQTYQTQNGPPIREAAEDQTPFVEQTCYMNASGIEAFLSAT